MKEYRISVSILESFRRYMAGVSSWDTEKALLDKLQGKFTGTDKTKIGHAFHKIIEDEVSEPSDLIVQGIFFSLDQVEIACKYVNNHPHMFKEILGKMLVETNHFVMQVSSRVDGVEGIEIRDTKTKFREPNFMEYYDSFQWRLYLEIFKCDVFWYDVFEIQNYKGNEDLTGVNIVAHEPYQCLRYDALSQEVEDLINRLANWIHANNYYKYLKLAK